MQPDHPSSTSASCALGASVNTVAPMYITATERAMNISSRRLVRETGGAAVSVNGEYSAQGNVVLLHGATRASRQPTVL